MSVVIQLYFKMPMIVYLIFGCASYHVLWGPDTIG